jgi:hypothetical protein
VCRALLESQAASDDGKDDGKDACSRRQRAGLPLKIPNGAGFTALQDTMQCEREEDAYKRDLLPLTKETYEGFRALQDTMQCEREDLLVQVLGFRVSGSGFRV